MLHLVQFVPYFPPHVGGLESYAQGLAKAWVAQGMGKMTIATFSPGQSTVVPEYDIDGYHVVVLPAWEIIKGFPLPKLWSPLFWRGIARLRSAVPNIVLTHTRFFATTPLGWWFARSVGCRWIHLEHGSGPVVGQGALVQMFSRLWDATLGRWALQNADALLAASEACRTYVETTSRRTDISVALQGIEISPIIRATNPIPVVVFVGRLVALKNVASLLRAAAVVANGGKNFKLRIVGDGPERRALETLVTELGIVDRTEFTGALSREKILSDVLPTADVFVNPSLQEGLPTTVIRRLRLAVTW